MLDAHELRALAESAPSEVLRRGSGRETFRWRGPRGERYVVKRYRPGRGGRLLWGRPARDEFESLRRLREAGLRVPEPIELYEDTSVALVVMEDVPHETDLRRRLTARPDEAPRWRPEVLALTLALHTRGWYHRDLYLDHFVLEGAPGEEGVCLLDLGRARQRRRPRRRWLVKDLAALLHSTPEGVSTLTRLRFLAGYLDARGISARQPRRWWRDAVLRKARRMAAHTPRGGVSYPATPEAQA